MIHSKMFVAKVKTLKPCPTANCKILELTGQKGAAMAQNSDGSEMNFLPLSNEEYHLWQGHPDGLTDQSHFLQSLLATSSESSNIIQSQDAEISVSSLQFLNNNHPIPTQTSRSADQSSYYQSRSPQNEPQYHTFNNMGGIYHTSPSHAGMSPPSSMTPTSPKKSPSIAERRFNFPPHPQQMAPYQMAHSSITSSVQALPETSQFSGEFGFELSFGPPTPGATKSIDYTYSHPLKKLYVQRGAHCPFKFKSKRPPPEGSYIKVLPVYKGTHVLSEPVKRCSNHAVGEEEAGNPDAQQRYHFVRCDNGSAKYENLEGGRLCVTFPFTGPQVGAEYQTELLSFQCFNSCGNSAHAKRRIDVIFTLEHQNSVLGRQVIEVRVCACPGRDRQNEEQNQNGGQRKRRTSYSIPQNAKKKNPGNNNEVFTITTRNPLVFEVMKNVKDILERAFETQTLEDSLLHLMRRAPNRPRTRLSQSPKAMKIEH